MRFDVVDPARSFTVGRSAIEIRDCAHIALAPDEQITLLTDNNAEYDVVRKSWGFYATPSINGRLKKFGLKAALIKGEDGKFFVFLVEADKEDELNRYLSDEHLHVACWLDDKGLLDLERKLG